MTPSFELLLALGVVGFYLWDSAMLLYANELVYLHDRGRWSFTTATSHWQLSGRNLYLPNLLRPDHALFRVHWSPVSHQSRQGHNGEVLQRLLNAIDTLRYLIYPLWLLLIVVLPVTLLLAGTGVLFLLVLGLVYGTILMLLFQIYVKRADLGLSRLSCAKLAFDSLACVPLALNLVRKITLRHSLGPDPVRFAQTRFDRTTFAHLVTTLSQWVANELVYEDESSQRFRNLSGYQQFLTSISHDI